MTISIKRLVPASFLAIGVAVIGVVAFSNHAALASTAKDCDDNAIIRCGLNDADPVGDFVNHYTSNNPGDIQSIFHFNGYELESIRKNAKLGFVTKDGNVYVGGEWNEAEQRMTGGELVATQAQSLGRQARPHGTPIEQNGVQYYYSRTQDSFQTNSIPAIVIMNGNQFVNAILTSCGNPVEAPPVSGPPTYSCDMLNRRDLGNQTFAFNTDATATNGAAIARVVYDFGDGTTEERTNPADVVTHHYQQPGNYTAKVTVYIHINGVEIPVEGPKCQTPVEVKPHANPPKPLYACTNLTARQIGDNKRKYEFTVTGQTGGGATLQDASFNFGDGQSANDIGPTANNTVKTEHTYAADGNYTITAALDFNAAQDVSDSQKCVVEVKITPPGQPTPPPTTPVTPASSVKELPSTGPMQIVGGAAGLGGIVASSYCYVNSRRNLLGALFKK